MAWIKISRLLLFILIVWLVAQDIHSFQMSILTGWQFQCANTTCIPFVTTPASSIRACQINCLAQVQCQAASFEQTTSSCELFANIQNQSGNMFANVEITTMIVISGTRMPPGQYKYNVSLKNHSKYRFGYIPKRKLSLKSIRSFLEWSSQFHRKTFLTPSKTKHLLKNNLFSKRWTIHFSRQY